MYLLFHILLFVDPISENNLLCLILDCFTADTNADTFLWMLAFIVAHEDVQQNIRDEVAKVDTCASVSP